MDDESLKKLVKDLNNLNLIQKHLDVKEDLKECVFKKYFFDSRFIRYGNDTNYFTEYTEAMSIFSINNGRFIGVYSIIDIEDYEETVESFDYKLAFIALKPIVKTEYVYL